MPKLNARQLNLSTIAEELSTVVTFKGDKGDKGNKGDKGDTPVKGVDYNDGEQGEPGPTGTSGAIAFIGLNKITVGTTEPETPDIGDLWIDTN
jgi:hypothetical protein